MSTHFPFKRRPCVPASVPVSEARREWPSPGSNADTRAADRGQVSGFASGHTSAPAPLCLASNSDSIHTRGRYSFRGPNGKSETQRLPPPPDSQRRRRVEFWGARRDRAYLPGLWPPPPSQHREVCLHSNLDLLFWLIDLYTVINI